MICAACVVNLNIKHNEIHVFTNIPSKHYLNGDKCITIISVFEKRILIGI